jgi:hypothetical protein
VGVRLNFPVARDYNTNLRGSSHGASPKFESNTRRDPQVESLRGAVSEVAKGQRHEREKVSGPRKSVGEARRQLIVFESS